MRDVQRLHYLFTLLMLISGCKKDSSDPVPPISSLVGKWRLEAYERIVNGQKTWETVTDNPPSYIGFRFNGVILDSDDMPYCCSPNSFVLNGNLFMIKPKADIPHNTLCDRVDCIGCENWDIAQNDDEIIISLSCTSSVSARKYKRE